ncbi:ER membrane protein complex subunit 1, putative [Plasmodium ovale]|uniref:ER membrane protein complex subunit 1 n=2 Tax=Plasmodium ovale TaxID=36330 RepID=A0A1D3U9W5_PLAOA|nr:ER membrane protein complex subunit 1, putative [Plasmodium ovale]
MQKMWFQFLVCFVAFVSKLTFQKNIPYSNIASLIGHINFIVPTQNLSNNFVLLSSVNGNVGLLNYKTGILNYVENHRENEKVKKLYGDDIFTAALIYKRGLEKDVRDGGGKAPYWENTYSYINVYNTLYAYLLNVFEYKNEIVQDFFIKNGKIFILLSDRIDVGNVNNNSRLSLHFKELNLNPIYSKIVQIQDTTLTLFFVDDQLSSHLVNIHFLIKTTSYLRKINELNLNQNVNNYVNIVNNKRVIIIYNKKYLHWVELLNSENAYYFNQAIINEEEEEELFKNDVVQYGEFIRDDGMDQWNAENFFVVKLGNDQFVYSYGNKTAKLVRKRKGIGKDSGWRSGDDSVEEQRKGAKNESQHGEEVVGYYINKHNKREMIFAEDKEDKIFLRKAMEDVDYDSADSCRDGCNDTIGILNKSSNLYYHGEIIIGVYNKEEKVNYFFSVYSDSSFTVYRNSEVYYTREESLAYIHQLYFYNFQHLKKKKKKNTSHGYSSEFNILKEIEKYIKEKISSFNKPYLEEVMNKKAELSLLPFNFFYLSIEEKLDLLNVRKDKKMGIRSSIPSKKEVASSDMKSNYHKFGLMQYMLELSFKRYEDNQSGTYAGSAIVLVATCNNLIFAIHLYTGLILYKIDGNKFTGVKNISWLKNNFCYSSLGKYNWSEVDNGKKLIFLNQSNELVMEKNTTDVGSFAKEGENGDANNVKKIADEIHLFKSFSTDSVITIFRGDNFSHICIFDVITGDVIFEKRIDSFIIQNFFIYKKGSCVIAVDNLLNTKVIPIIGEEKSIQGINEEDLFFYTINQSRYYIEGYRLMDIPWGDRGKEEEGKNGIGLMRTYSISLNGEEIVVFAKSVTKKDIFYPIKINKDASICYKYINDNILSYITRSVFKESIIYTLYIIDGISGSLIYSRTLDKYTKPPFHMLISENILVLHFFNDSMNKYVIKIIELLLDKKDPGFISLITSKKDKVVDLFDVKKIVVKEKNYIIDHNIKSFHFTETKKGITNKHILILLDTNKIAPLHIGNEKENIVYKNMNTFITQTDILYKSKGFISNESSLESTTLVFSWGSYLYFTCYQPNGSFDTMQNINLLLLIFLIILVFIGTYISYIKRINKILYAKWA